MITGIDTRLAQDFVSKFDSGEPKTVWKIGVLSSYAFARIGSKIADQSKALEGMIEIVKFGLKGFDNLKDKDGKDVQFITEDTELHSRTSRVVSDSIMDIIPVDVIIELGGKILEITRLSEQVIKN